MHATPAAPARTIVLLGAAGVLLGGVEAAVLVDDGGTWLDLLFPLTAVHYWLCGLVIAARRPANGTGALLLLVAVTVFVTQLPAFGNDVLTAIGLVFQTVCLAAFLHVLLALPGGRLETPTARRIVGVGYVMAVVANVHTWLFTPGPAGPGTVLRIGQNAELVDVWRLGGSAVYGLVTAATVVVLVRRRRRVPAGQRPTIGALYDYGIVAALVLWAVPNIGRRAASTSS
ncbi:MAG TPA: hypothetical protein VN238_17960 [Solirubrobacteraceae bacterium]|nr:hypothetical protein [Solirubrobacteraceae bacterium]